MPRLPTALFRRAHGINPLLARLLPVCRSLQDARNELSWMEKHIIHDGKPARRLRYNQHLSRMVARRARGEPLQYILGSEFFGDVEVICKPGVLIPRPETAEITQFLASRLLENSGKLPQKLGVLDLCTGTGCIPLQLRECFRPYRAPALDILGVDISARAVKLARLNEKRQAELWRTERLPPLQVQRADVLADSTTTTSGAIPSIQQLLDRLRKSEWDVMISNPPYISPRSFLRTTARSVRLFEPKIALVPPAKGLANPSNETSGDSFYPRLLHIASEVGAKVLLMEVADMAQAIRIARTVARKGTWDGVEIWRDGNLVVDGRIDGFSMKGDGNGRAVLCWTGEGGQWLGMN